MSNKNGRNELCSCGSGKKFKKCCGFKAQAQKQRKASIIGKAGLNPFFSKQGADLATKLFKVVKTENTPQMSSLKVTKKEQ